MTETVKDGATAALTPPTEPVHVGRDTMQGDLVKVVIDELKAAGTWQKLAQLDQDRVLERVDAQVRSAVEEVVRIIAADDRPTLLAKVESVMFKGTVKATLALEKSNPARHDLADSHGQEVLLVIPYGDRYLGGDRPKSESNQRALLDNEGKATPEATAAAKPKRTRKPKGEKAAPDAGAGAGDASGDPGATSGAAEGGDAQAGAGEADGGVPGGERPAPSYKEGGYNDGRFQTGAIDPLTKTRLDTVQIAQALSGVGLNLDPAAIKDWPTADMQAAYDWAMDTPADVIERDGPTGGAAFLSDLWAIRASLKPNAG